MSDRPVFLFGCAYRCGSTLLQRLLSSTGELFIWGENMAISELLGQVPERVSAWRWESYQEEQWRTLEKTGVAGWICNLNPRPLVPSLRTALRAFYETYYGEATRALGRSRWGFKEVHHGAATARFLTNLFPDCRVVFLLRNPVDVLASVAPTSWYDEVGGPGRVLDLWRRNTESLLAWEDARLLVVRFEKLVAEPTTELERIGAHVGVDAACFDRNLLARRERGGMPEPALGPAERAALRDAAFVRGVRRAGYDVDLDARLVGPAPLAKSGTANAATSTTIRVGAPPDPGAGGVPVEGGATSEADEPVDGGPEGAAGVEALGHRRYVGGLWDEVGRLQFEFLKGHGLKPDDTLLDIGCGALRGGVHFVRYLGKGAYLGMEKEPLLIEQGSRQELGESLLAEKQPELLVSADFAFERFDRVPDVALAHSLFTHLTPAAIERCLQRLRAFVRPGCRLFATFFESDEPMDNPFLSHDHRGFRYTRGQMESFGVWTGWEARYLGDWQHPRGQVMVEYVARTVPATAADSGDRLPEVSVILCTYNRCAILTECLASFFDQTAAPGTFEIVVVDDGSTDDTPAMLDELDSPVPLRCVRQDNAGLAAARNAGIAAGSGRLLLFINDDTIAAPDLIESHLAAHAAHAGRSIAVLGTFEQPPEALENALTFHLETSDEVFCYATTESGQLHDWNRFWTCNVSVAAEEVRAAGGFDVAFRQYGCEDTDLGARLFARGVPVLFAAAARARHRHVLGFDDLKRRSHTVARAYVRFFRKHPHLLAHEWWGWVAPLDRNACAEYRAARQSRSPSWEAQAREIAASSLAALEEESGHAGARARLDQLAGRLRDLNALWWREGFVDGFDDLHLSGFPELVATAPWPLGTRAPRKVVAWPDYSSPADLQMLMENFGRILQGRKDTCFCLRHDPGVDGPVDEAMERLKTVHDSILGKEAVLDVLLVGEPMQRDDWPRLGRSVDWALALPSSRQPVRSSFFDALDVPVLAAATDLEERLGAPRPDTVEPG
ncbi:MAG: glycosyltransferase [Acidobacteriota bacterium]